MTSTQQQAISAGVHRIEEAATYGAETQFSSGKFRRGLNLCLGMPAAVGAAVAGAAGLADNL